MTSATHVTVMRLITIAVFAVLLGRAIQLQILDGDRYHAESSRRAGTDSPKGAGNVRAGDTP